MSEEKTSVMGDPGDPLQIHTASSQPETMVGVTTLVTTSNSSPYNVVEFTREDPYLTYLSNGRIQSPITIQWLLEHLEPCERGSLPRNSLYSLYHEYCNQAGICINPVNAASFGKLVRQTFPFIRTRRLGTRGQSKYHYYGIRVKAVSPYFNYFNTLTQRGVFSTPRRQYSPGCDDSSVSSDLLTGSHCALNAEHLRARHPHLDANSLLPNLPSAYALTLPSDIPIGQAQTFLVMYQAHCQILVDTILRANFLEIESNLKQFWQGIPSDLLAAIGCHVVIDQVALFDWQLYKNLLHVLIPHPMEPMISSFVQALRQFSKCYILWIQDSTFHIPANMSKAKMQVGKMFTTSLRRQTAMTHLCQACRGHFSRSENVDGMLHDWKSLDLESINKQILWINGTTTTEADYKCLKQAEAEFESLIGHPVTLMVDWVSRLMDKAILQLSASQACKFDVAAQNFFLKWTFVSNKIIRDLTLKSAESFGSFHLIQTVLNEYILYLLEAHTNEVIETQLVTSAQASQKPDSEVEAPYAVQVEFLPELISTAQSTSSSAQLLPSLIPISAMQQPQLIFTQCPVDPDIANDSEICPQQNIIVTSFHPCLEAIDRSNVIQASPTDSTPHTVHTNTDDHTYSRKTNTKQQMQSDKAESRDLPRLRQHLCSRRRRNEGAWNGDDKHQEKTQ